MAGVLVMQTRSGETYGGKLSAGIRDERGTFGEKTEVPNQRRTNPMQIQQIAWTRRIHRPTHFVTGLVFVRRVLVGRPSTRSG